MYVPGRTNNIYIASVKTALRLSLKVFSANIIKCLMLNKKKPKSKNKKKTNSCLPVYISLNQLVFISLKAKGDLTRYDLVTRNE